MVKIAVAVCTRLWARRPRWHNFVENIEETQSIVRTSTTKCRLKKKYYVPKMAAMN